MVLRVRLDRPGPSATAEDSVSVEDCARVSRDLSAVLDVEDVVPMATRWKYRRPDSIVRCGTQTITAASPAAARSW